MVKVVTALAASARVTPPDFTTHLSKTLPSGIIAVTVISTPAAAEVMAFPDADAVPPVTVTAYSVAAGFFTNFLSPQPVRWQV